MTMLAFRTPAQDLEPAHYQNFEPYQYNLNTFRPNSTPPQLTSLQRQQLMSTGLQQLPNPPIRVQNPSPFSEGGAQQQMLAQGQYFGDNWGSNESLLNPVKVAQNGVSRGTSKNSHKRASSASSSASAGPPSPQSNTTAFPQIAGLDVAGYSPSAFDSSDIFATAQGGMQKSLPTPIQTPTQNNFNLSDYRQQFSSPQDAQNQLGMRRTLQDNRSANDDDGQSYPYSAPHSVSSVSHHGSPATPQTAYDDYDDAAKNLQNSGFNPQFNSIPSSMSSVQFDDLYSNQLQNIASPRQQQQRLSPFRTSLANRFQAAQLDHVASRTGSPVASISREKSPFKQEALYNTTVPMTGQRLGPPQMTHAQYQQSLGNIGNSNVFAQHQQPQQRRTQSQEPPKTVSPKDVELDYHDEDQTPLFPSSQTSQFSLPREESNFSAASAFGQPNQYYTAVPQQTQQYAFLNQQPRQRGNTRSGDQSQPLPDFPAHLTSMETTASSSSEQEATPQTQAPPTSMPIARPQDTSADLGTYTCTYHGCSQRFDSALRLQKHRKDAHRQPSPNSSNGDLPPAAVPGNHGHVTSASTIALRNSQSGPHRCDRINPTTGKPCNSVFSRPYDLTRHEDTIHNARKLKVRCHLCTEEKSFSRNDALTRHMRVVHPEVDWPGKTKRKGRD